ncbi:deoxyribose-phosphate aldolase [bacterium]|nr:deoxyribose-phosphate aldolase [bacterium]
MKIAKETVLERARELAEILEIPQIEVEKIRENLDCSYIPPEITKEAAAKAVDHTVLSFNAVENDIVRICNEAQKYGFKAVCINPVWIKTAVSIRKQLNADFLIATVIDFPLGASTSAAKTAEAIQAAIDGADEIDVVINIGLLKSRRFKECFEILKSTMKTKAYVKVILETSELSDDEKVYAALIAVFAGADMLKTSTGVNGKATVEDVRLLRMIAGSRLGVKAAGGIREKETLVAMMKAGADRIGCSSSVKIMENW